MEAEAGGEDEDGKLLVANVVLNRVNNESFPDPVAVRYSIRNACVAAIRFICSSFRQIHEVTKIKLIKFSPTVDGRFQNVKVSQETYEAVERALYGEDISQGALYFCARKKVPVATARKSFRIF